jgi:hypothetical protein
MLKNNKKSRKDKGHPCPQRGRRYTAYQRYSIWEFISTNWERLQNEPVKVFTGELGIPMITISKIIKHQSHYEKNKII